MKKFQFAVLAFAAICMIACKDKKKEEPTTPSEEPESGYVCPIIIDGTGAEYDALPNAIVEKHAEGCSSYPAVKVLKVYSDEVYTNVYIEFDKTQFPLANEGAIDGDGNVSGAQFHIYFANNDDPETFGYNTQWATNMTLCLEGVWMENKALVESLSCDQFGVDPDADDPGWPWDGGLGINPIVNSKVTDKALEIQLKTVSIGLPQDAGFLYIAVDMQDAWNSVGILPNASDEMVDDLPVAVKAHAAKMIINTVEE